MSGGGGGGSRGHKRHEEHEEHEEHVNHEAWVIPYADMLTLLMALFLVLFAIGRTDLDKFKKLAESFKKEFGNSSTEVVSLGGSGDNATGDGGAGVLAADMPMVVVTTVPPSDSTATSTTLSAGDEAISAENAATQAAVNEANSLEGVQQTVQSLADAYGIGDSLNFTLDARGLVVTIVTDKVLFTAGDADLGTDGVGILDIVAQALAKVPNDVSIEGHTDNRPISNSRYADNWALSNARATSVLRYFITKGVAATRLSSSGYADTRPIADNSTPEGQARNRRVEVVVKAEVSLTPLLNPDGTVSLDAPAPIPLSADTAAATTPTESTVAQIPGVVPDLDPAIAPNGAAGTSGDGTGQ